MGRCYLNTNQALAGEAAALLAGLLVPSPPEPGPPVPGLQLRCGGAALLNSSPRASGRAAAGLQTPQRLLMHGHPGL